MKLLVVDDEQTQRESLAGFLRKRGYSVGIADSAQTALAYMTRQSVDVVLSDFKMPYMTGTDLLQEIKQRSPTVVVILMTAYGTVEIAVEAMKAGAWDFLSKPVELDQLESILEDVDSHLAAIRKAQDADLEDIDTLPDHGFITHDPKMRDILTAARKAARSRATILITGETGTGKEVLARFIHRESNRADQPLYMINCAALPGNLVESELFGVEKGAYTGADKARAGRLEDAHNGTVFLDEIGDLPLETQVKLLRFLENGDFQRLGENKTRSADVRILAATNIDLSHAVEQGEFREDLYFRLNVIHFHIPPLRERKEDILPLTDLFLKEFARREGKPEMTITKNAKSRLLEYSFPGNVRELRNLIERAVILSADSTTVAPDDLQFEAGGKLSSGDGTLNDKVRQMERDMIRETLEQANGNQSECARRLGISERVLRYKLDKYHLR